MKNFKIVLFIITIFQIDYINQLSAQTQLQDSLAFETVKSNTIYLFSQSAGAQSSIFNGAEYYFERINFGNAFFDTTSLVNGQVVYDDLIFNSVPLLYDIVKDVLVTTTFNKHHLTYLTSDKVSQFSLLGHTFIRISEDSLNGSVIKTGFYQNLYNGKVKAWAKNKKTIMEFTDHEIKTKKMVIDKKRWYIYKEGTYFEVIGKNTILKVFPDKKREIQQYCRKNKIRFRNNIDRALAEIVGYYDNITNY